MSRRVPTRQHTVNTADALTSLLVEVIRLAEFFTQRGEGLAKPEGQTLARWLVLEALEDGPKPVADIARNLRLARQSVQRVADLLVRDGLVAYETNPRHRRAKLARLTPAGRKVLGRIQRAHRELAAHQAAEVGLGDLEQATELLRRIRGILTAA